MSKNNLIELVERIRTDYKAISEEIDSMEISTLAVRYQDYFLDMQSSKENIEYFFKNCPNNSDENVLAFCKSLLKKRTEDLLDVVDTWDGTPEELSDMLMLFNEDKYFEDIEFLIKVIYKMLEEVKSKTLDSIPTSISNPVNLIIMPENFSEVIDVNTVKNTGVNDKSLSAAARALKTLMSVSYSDREMAPKIHKFKDNGDLRLSNRAILAERYKSKDTKVMFLKMPLDDDNREILRKMYNNPPLENIYYIIGFGDFGFAGYSEADFYAIFVKMAKANEKYFQKCVDLVGNPLIVESNGVKQDKTKELRKLLDDSLVLYQSLYGAGEKSIN